jgi:hypothetical protein
MKTGLESLDTGAPEITYSGNEGPKSPQQMQQMQQMQMAQLEEEYDAYVDDMLEQGIEPMSMQQFLEQIAAEAQMSSNEEGIGSMMEDPRQMAADGGVAMQGGVENYLGRQPEVQAPRKWQSSPDKPATELAYITKAEKDLIIKKNIHGGLEDGPNMGPSGIMSLDSFGDIGGGQSGAQFDSSQGSGSQSDRDRGAGNFTNTAEEQKQQQENLDNAARVQEQRIAEQFKNEQEAKKRAKEFKAAQEKEAKETAQTKSFFEKIAEARTKSAKMRLAKSINKKLGLGLDPKDDDFLNQVTRAGETTFSTPDMNDDFAVDYDMSSYGLKGTDLARGKKQFEVMGQDNISQRDFENVYRPYDQMFVDGEFTPGPILPAGGGGGGGGGGQQTQPGDGTPPGDGEGGLPDIPTDFVDLSGTQSYTNPAFAGQYFYGTPTITLANGGRANFAGGGIANLRQGYFLGKLVKSITKPFKKAFRGFKKIAKSPLGKMALMYFGGNLLQGNALFGNPLSSNLTNKLGGMFTGGGGGGGGFKGITEGFKNIAKSAFKPENAFATISGISGLSGLYTNYINNKREDESMADYQRRLEEERRIQPDIPVNFVDFSQPAANGGRMGFADGGDDDDEDESIRSKALGALYQKLAMGGSAGLPPVTMQTEGQDTQSFGDDESTGMPQATPTMQNQMPMRQPMMDPRIQNQMMMAQRGNPMMNRGMMSMQQPPRIMAQEGGMMDMGGMEKDYRNEGGFVPIGGQERADDVPARLSKMSLYLQQMLLEMQEAEI